MVRPITSISRVIRWLSIPTCVSQQHMISRAVIGNGKARVGGGELWDYQGLPATCVMLPFTELQPWFIFLLHKDSHLSWTGFDKIKTIEWDALDPFLKTGITTHSPFCKSIDHPSIRFYRAMVSVWWIYSEGSWCLHKEKEQIGLALTLAFNMSLYASASHRSG